MGQSADSDCPGFETPVALNLGTPSFYAPADLTVVDRVHSNQELEHQIGFKILQNSPGVQSVMQKPLDGSASYSGVMQAQQGIVKLVVHHFSLLNDFLIPRFTGDTMLETTFHCRDKCGNMPEIHGQNSLTLPIRQDIQYWPRGLTTIFGRNPSGPDWSFALPNAITGDSLCKAIEEQTFIKNGALKCAEGIKYDFRMGSQVLKAKFGRSMDMAKMSEEQKAEMVVDPGEVVFVLTEEILQLPDNIMAQLMPKRKLSHDGILVLGGFCVDPLYSGKLLVGLYNFSSSTFVLDPGRKLIAAVFFELQESETGAFRKPESEVVDFPLELVRMISSYQPIDLSSLRDNISGLELQINNLRAEITTDKEWKKDFQSSLEKLAENVTHLLKGLEDEKQNRMLADKEITADISTLKIGAAESKTQSSNTHTLLVAIIAIVITFLVTAPLAIFGYWLAVKP